MDTIWNLRSIYVDKIGGEEIRKFKYKGNDFSISYKYIYEPIAKYLVTFIPKNIAPNLITFTSWILIIISQILFAYYSWEMNNEYPNWLNILYPTLIYLYTILDNIDGKQAVRTKSISVLGSLLDHGVDAFSVVPMIMIVCTMFQYGLTYLSFFLISICAFILHMKSVEEYYFEYLELGVINGPSDGPHLIAFFHFTVAIFGYKFIAEKIIFEYSLVQIMILVFILYFFLQIISIFFKFGTKGFQGIISLLYLSSSLFIEFFIIFFLVYKQGFFSRLSCYTLIFMISKSKSYLQLSYVQKRIHQPFTFTFILNLFLGVLSFCMYIKKPL